MRKRAAVTFFVLVGAAPLGCSSGGESGDGGDGSASSDVEAPEVTVTGPISGGTYGVPYNAMPEEFAETYGYSEEEFFVAGEARAYEPVGPLTTDGEWEVEPNGTAPYETRIVVRRPVDPGGFNGIAVVEWLNVTSGRDADPDFGFLYPELLEQGYAYVAVSAQRTGVAGGGAILEVPGVPEVALAPLEVWDPERYDPLRHPGDEYSYDIFTQVGQLVAAGDVLGGLEPDVVLGVGESQSAIRLVTYVNAVAPLAAAYDGYLIHSRGDGGAPLTAGSGSIPPDDLAVRGDLTTPVLQFETETDLLGLGFLGARQPDSDTVRTWEVAGTAHADGSTLEYGRRSAARVWYDGPDVDFRPLCGVENLGPGAPVLRAAFTALSAWVVDGTRPPTSPRILTSGDEIVVDALGNAVGGVRTPAVDAPVSTLTGESTAESVFCSLFGSSTPLAPEQLMSLYPTHADYVEKVTASAGAAVEAGYLLPDDGGAMIEEAKAADVPPG